MNRAIALEKYSICSTSYLSICHQQHGNFKILSHLIFFPPEVHLDLKTAGQPVDCEVLIFFSDMLNLGGEQSFVCFLESPTASAGSGKVCHEELICIGQKMKEVKHKGARGRKTSN